MTDQNFHYWVRLEPAVLVLAALMSQVGTLLWIATIPRPSFGIGDLIIPSCLTWTILAPFLRRASIRRAVWIGLLSPFVGGALVVLLGIGPAKRLTQSGDLTQALAGFLGGLIYASTYVGITAWTTLPCGAATGLLMRGLFRLWPLEEERESFDWRAHLSVSLKARVLLSASALVPLLGLLLRPSRDNPVQQILGSLTQLYFFPVHLAVFRTEAVAPILIQPGVLQAIEIAYALGLAALIFRFLGRLQRDRRISARRPDR